MRKESKPLGGKGCQQSVMDQQPWWFSEESLHSSLDAEERSLREEVRSLLKDVRVQKISSADGFWCLYNQMHDARICRLQECVHNRSHLLEAWRDDKLYCLEIDKLALFDDLEKRGRLQKMLLTHSAADLTIPAFCVVEHGSCDLMWVAPTFRRMGLGSVFVDKLEIKKISKLAPTEAEPFWKHHYVCEAALISCVDNIISANGTACVAATNDEATGTLAAPSEDSGNKEPCSMRKRKRASNDDSEAKGSIIATAAEISSGDVAGGSKQDPSFSDALAQAEAQGSTQEQLQVLRSICSLMQQNGSLHLQELYDKFPDTEQSIIRRQLGKVASYNGHPSKGWSWGILERVRYWNGFNRFK